MKRWGLRASSLSADTKADAGQNTSNNHLTPNVFYMMLNDEIAITLIKLQIQWQLKHNWAGKIVMRRSFFMAQLCLNP